MTVVAGQVAYQTGKRAPEFVGQWVVRERAGKVTVLRAYTPPYLSSFMGRIWAYFAFTLSATWTAMFCCQRPEVIVATSPPLVVAIPGRIAALWWRVPWVFEVHDLWPESGIATGVIRPDSFVARVLYLVEKHAYRTANKINVLTPPLRENIMARDLAAASKIVFLPNGANLDLFQPGPRDNDVRREYGWGDKFVVLYAGAHARIHHLIQYLEAARLLRDRDDMLFVMVGDGPERSMLLKKVEEWSLRNVQLLGAQPKERMPAFVQASDVGTAVLAKNDTSKTIYPTKVFDYMACKRPCLVAIYGVGRRLVAEEAKAGICVEPENPEELAAAVVQLSKNPAACREFGERGLRFVRAHFSWEEFATRYAEVLADLAERSAERNRGRVKAGCDETGGISDPGESGLKRSLDEH